MRRSIEYCDWQAQWWSAQSELRTDVSPQLKEGLIAYALSHVDFERSLAERLRRKWARVQTRALEFLETTHLNGITKLYSTSSALAEETLDDNTGDFTVELDVDDILEDEDEYD